MFVFGDELETFEAEFAAYCGIRHAIGVGNGTDAIVLALRSLGIGPGDEVITAPNSFLASASAIVLSGATPVFADVGPDYNLDPQRVDDAVTGITRAILAVHLTGRPADMDGLSEVAKKHGLALVEDAAQAVGAELNGRKTGSLGDIACFSFHPLKTLNAIGDGGAVTTDRTDLRDWLMKGRNHGLKNRDEAEFWSVNSRLDTLQAAVLGIKLKHLDSLVARRREIALRYTDALGDIVGVPIERPEEKPAYHTYVIRASRRDELRAFLGEHGIDTKVHYPVPIHLQPAYGGLVGSFPEAERQASEILSLPVHQNLSDEQVGHVILSVQSFFGVHTAK